MRQQGVDGDCSQWIISLCKLLHQTNAVDHDSWLHFRKQINQTVDVLDIDITDQAIR